MSNQVPSPDSRQRWARRLASAAVAAAVLTSITAIEATPAQAATPSTIAVSGHGWGHGRGMGQYGAQGYATMYGWTSAAILDRFYSGTSAGTIANQPLTVRLVAMDGVDLAVTSGAPFTVGGYDQSAGRAVFFTRDAGGNLLIAGGNSCAGPTDGWVPATGPVAARSLVANPGDDLTKMLTICNGPTYRGQLLYLFAEGAVHTINSVMLEDYVRGVVPRESPSSFAPAALEAQAVAARSYAMAEGGESGSRYTFAKTCDTTSCQVYGGAGLNGVRREAATTDAATANTAGLVRRFTSGAALARTEFSSSTGGWTAGGNFAPVSDAGDAVPSNPRHNWQTSLSTAAIASRYAIGGYVDMKITQRNGLGDWGGRAQKVSIIGTSGSVSVTGAQFQTDWALFSDWFTIDGANGPTAVSPSNGRVDVFSRASDSVVWQRTQTASNPGAWASIGGTMTSDVDATTWGNGRIDLFSRGVEGALWHRWSSDGVVWSAWESLGGILASGPTAVSWGVDRIDIFAMGIDGAIWTLAWNGAGWTKWSSLGGGLIGDPDVASWGPGRLDLFIRGLDGALWHRGFAGSWMPWESLGGGLTSGPGAVSWGGNRIDIFVRGLDGGVWSRGWVGTGWSGWYSIGGLIASDPDVASPAQNFLTVVARAPDGAVWKNMWTNSTSWSGWSSLGAPG